MIVSGSFQSSTSSKGTYKIGTTTGTWNAKKQQ
jgi:hypothetical protein